MARVGHGEKREVDREYNVCDFPKDVFNSVLAVLCGLK